MKQIIYIDNFLKDHGYSPVTGYAVVSLLRSNGYTVIAASNKKKQFPRLLHMLRTILLHRKNAVVLIATYSTAAFYFAYSCSVLCRMLRIPYLPYLHGGNLPERMAAAPFLSGSYFGNSTMNIAVSGYLQQAMLVKGWPCVIIPNYINTGQYPFRQRTTVKPKLLWVRSFHSVYNPQMAIKVLITLRGTHPDAMLTMVGPERDGSLSECKKLAAAAGLANQVKFTGKLEQKEWIQLAATHDIFINTTNADNLPVSIIEATALGMIVISTNVGGIPYLIQDGINGLLVNANDTEGMVSSINKVIIDKNIANALSRKARVCAVQYDEQYVSEQWKSLLSKFN